MSADDGEVVERPRGDAAVRDGIGEEDAAIPLWFNVGFYGFIVFGLLYIGYYLGSGWSQEGQYAAEAARLEERFAAVRAEQPDTNPYRGDPAALAEGAEVFASICSACHRPDGQGLVGPSLVDPYWKYGSSDAELFVSVADGRPLGMPPWGAQLGTEKIWKVLAYIDSLPRSSEPGIGAPDHQASSAGAAP